MTDATAVTDKLLKLLGGHPESPMTFAFKNICNQLITEALDARAREVWIEAGNDLSHGLPLIWKKALIDRCAFKAEQCRAQAEGVGDDGGT